MYTHSTRHCDCFSLYAKYSFLQVSWSLHRAGEFKWSRRDNVDEHFECIDKNRTKYLEFFKCVRSVLLVSLFLFSWTFLIWRCFSFHFIPFYIYWIFSWQYNVCIDLSSLDSFTFLVYIWYDLCLRARKRHINNE